MKEQLTEAIKNLSPAYFAMVMATGVVSSAAFFLEMDIIAYPLFWVNIVLYAVLCVATLLRIILFREQLLTDLLDHVRGMGFFTLVTATSLLGTQFIILKSNFHVAKILWLIVS